MGAGPPWARILGPEAGSEEGTFGVCGNRTEQFAIGSVLYCMTRGHEPFEMDDFEDVTEPVNRLQRMEFPPASDTELDRIIERRWRGQFSSVKDLPKRQAHYPVELI